MEGSWLSGNDRDTLNGTQLIPRFRILEVLISLCLVKRLLLVIWHIACTTLNKINEILLLLIFSDNPTLTTLRYLARYGLPLKYLTPGRIWLFLIRPTCTFTFWEQNEAFKIDTQMGLVIKWQSIAAFVWGSNAPKPFSCLLRVVNWGNRVHK